MFDGKSEKEFKVLIPSEFIKEQRNRNLYGYFHNSTGIFNVVSSYRKNCGMRLLGRLNVEKDDKSVGLGLHGYYTGLNEAEFVFKDRRYEVELYDTCLNIFSRNTGILESEKMLNKRAVILGCGSVGSYVALELARAGVGYFLLIDMDIVEYHNLCRHQCGISDVGRFKTEALSARIKDINPLAQVVCVSKPIENIGQTYFEKMCCGTDAIVIGCADNRSADAYANMVAARMGACFLSIGFSERAVAGEIFYWIPGKNMPCCSCALGNTNTPKAETNYHHVYSNELEAEKIKFAPGISADISFITIIGVKLALDMLNISDTKYIPRLLNNLKQYTLICNTNNSEIGGNVVEIFSYPLQITTSLKVNFGARCNKYHQCIYE